MKKDKDWDRFVKENHTNFDKDANGIKYEFYEDDILDFINNLLKEQLMLKGLEDFAIFREERDKALKEQLDRVEGCIYKDTDGIHAVIIERIDRQKLNKLKGEIK